MLVIDLVGPRDILVIPAIVACLIAANKQNGHATRIKRIENPVRAPAVLDPQPSYESVLTSLCQN